MSTLLVRMTAALLTTAFYSLAGASSLPESAGYRGEIRRDADGKLVAVPTAPRTETGTQASTTAPPIAPQRKSEKLAGQTATQTARITDTGGPAKTIRVGPQQAVRSISVAATMARDGDTIEIEAGDYIADVASWKQNRLTIRGVGPTRPRLIANGANAEGKAIWVVKGGQITVDNIEFRGARVPDKNGAGIRFEKGHLIVRNSKFEDNENGILSGSGADMQLDIENSEFGHNGAGDGRSHNIYIGHIGKLTVSGSYFHHARTGHLLKSRASESHIFYNRLTDEIGGKASYELDFSNGGIAYVVGNLIEQSSQTENSNIISFGPEGYQKGSNELYLINNTIADNRPHNGNILLLKSGASKVVLMNNLLVTRSKFSPKLEENGGNNINVDWDQFVLPQRYDFRLLANSKLIGKYLTPLPANGVGLIPQREYVHPTGSRPLSSPGRMPGAFQTTGP